MKILVSIAQNPGWDPRMRVFSLNESETYPISIPSEYLISAGQPMHLFVNARRATDDLMPGVGPLEDARILGVVRVAKTWNLSYIPSERPLYAILDEVVQHSVEFPTHGMGCVCMDNFSYEITRHVSRVLPDVDASHSSTEDWQRNFDARSRIRHVLRMVENRL